MYALTHSGPVIIGLAILGVLLVALGGGTAGQATVGPVRDHEESGFQMIEDTGIWPGSSSSISVRVRLLFYGIGLVGWSLTVLGLFSSSLH